MKKYILYIVLMGLLISLLVSAKQPVRNLHHLRSGAGQDIGARNTTMTHG